MAVKKLLIHIGTKGARQSSRLLGSVGGSLKRITQGASLAGLGIAGLSIKLAGDFSKSLREISTLMDNVTEKDIKNMSNELRLLSGSSGLALASLSKAKYDIVSAGFSSAGESAMVLATSARLAVGGVTEASSSADILTTALNAYGLSADKANHVADILFTTVRFGKTTMDELAGSMGRVLPISKSANATLETVGSAMATITASGLNTAEATTSLRGAFKALVAPVGASAEAMKQAGITAIRFDDGTLDLLSTMQQFVGMDLDVLTKFIPDVTASTAIQMMATNIGVLEDNLKAFETTVGATDTAFGKMAQEFNIKMSKLKNNISAGMIEIGNALINKITPAVDIVNRALEKIGDIGWDVVGKRIGEHWRLILETLVGTVGTTVSVIGDVFSIGINNILMDMSWAVRKLLGISVDGLEKQNQDAQVRINSFTGIIKSGWQEVFDILTEPPPPTLLVDFTDPAVKMAHYMRLVEEGYISILDIVELLPNAVVIAEKTKQEAIIKTGEVIKVAGDEEKARFETTLSGVRSAVKGYLAQAVAVMLVKEIGKKGLAGLVTGTIGAVAVASLFDAVIPKFAQGGIVQGQGTQDNVPVMASAGELILNKAQQESLANNMGGITINISAPLVDETVVESIIPAIEKAQRLGLA